MRRKRKQEQSCAQLPEARPAIIAGISPLYQVLNVQPASLVGMGTVFHSKNLRAAVAAHVSRIALTRLKMVVSWRVRSMSTYSAAESGRAHVGDGAMGHKRRHRGDQRAT